jgi:hypothetical protein
METVAKAMIDHLNRGNLQAYETFAARVRGN